MGETAAATDVLTRGHAAPLTRTVVLVDEQPLWVSGLQAELERAGVKVLAAALDPAEGLAAAQRLRPDAFVVALEMPHAQVDGPEFIRRARVALPQTRIVALSAHANPLYGRAALAAGVDAVALKTASAEEIVAAIRRPHAEQEHAQNDGNGAPALTPRELEILELVARGYTNGTIAKRLWVTEWTVKFHLANAYRKLGVSNRTQAARYLLDRAAVGR